jgi:hypothetical protein
LDTYTHENNIGTVDFLSIDVEGYDWPVIQGGTATLQGVRYLEFEYHAKGVWGKQTTKLSEVVQHLKQAGFVCYWAGQHKLWRITDCWLEEYNRKKCWSNVACVPASHLDLANRMEELFETCLEEAR